MGYMSKQWLNRGRGIRDKSHRVDAVSVSCASCGTVWLKEKGIRVEFRARKGNGEYQELLLSETEINDSLRVLIRYASVDMREKVMLTLMRELSDRKLLRLLALDLRKRRLRLPRQS